MLCLVTVVSESLHNGIQSALGAPLVGTSVGVVDAVAGAVNPDATTPFNGLIDAVVDAASGVSAGATPQSLKDAFEAAEAPKSIGAMWTDVLKDKIYDSPSEYYDAGLTDVQKNAYNQMPSGDAGRYKDSCLAKTYDESYLSGKVPVQSEFQAVCYKNLENMVKLFDAGYIQTLSEDEVTQLVKESQPVLAALNAGSLFENLNSLQAGTNESLYNGLLAVSAASLPGGMSNVYAPVAYKAMLNSVAEPWVKANMKDISRLPEEIQDNLFSGLDMDTIRTEYALSQQGLQPNAEVEQSNPLLQQIKDGLSAILPPMPEPAVESTVASASPTASPDAVSSRFTDEFAEMLQQSQSNDPTVDL